MASATRRTLAAIDESDRLDPALGNSVAIAWPTPLPAPGDDGDLILDVHPSDSSIDDIVFQWNRVQGLGSGPIPVGVPPGAAAYAI